MKIALLPLLTISALALLSSGCEKTAPVPDSAVLFQAIQDNARAVEKKDADAVMATIHPHSPSYVGMRPMLNEMFQAVDLKNTLSDLKVVTASADEAQVSFVQRTEKVGGQGQFRDNIVEGVHTLRPDSGRWKIYRSVQTKVTGLDGKPLTAPEEAAPTPEAPPAPVPAAEPAPKPAAPAEKPAP